MRTDEVTVYIVSATSLESVRRTMSRVPTQLAVWKFDSMPPEEKPVPTELARVFSQEDAERIAESLHASWYRPSVRVVKEPVDAQHYAHGGHVGR
jgi:hypothetical protein